MSTTGVVVDSGSGIPAPNGSSGTKPVVSFTVLSSSRSGWVLPEVVQVSEKGAPETTPVDEAWKSMAVSGGRTVIWIVGLAAGSETSPSGPKARSSRR